MNTFATEVIEYLKINLTNEITKRSILEKYWYVYSLNGIDEVLDLLEKYEIISFSANDYGEPIVKFIKPTTPLSHPEPEHLLSYH